jgi:hypothetical protein
LPAALGYKRKNISINPKFQDVPRTVWENPVVNRIAKKLSSWSPPIKVVTDPYESQAPRAYVLIRDYNEFTSAFAGEIDRIFTYTIIRTPHRHSVLSSYYGDEKNLHSGVLRDIYSFSDSAFAKFVDFINQRNGAFISVDPNQDVSTSSGETGNSPVSRGNPRPNPLWIDTNVLSVDEKVICLSDQFDHFDYYSKEYAKWHSIPTTRMVSEARRLLYSKAIGRLYDQGRIKRTINLYNLPDAAVVDFTGANSSLQRAHELHTYSFITHLMTMELDDAIEYTIARHAKEEALLGVPADPNKDDWVLAQDDELDALIQASRAAKARRIRKNSF